MNAVDAVLLYIEEPARDGRTAPAPRPLAVLRRDLEFREQLEGHRAALISVPSARASAA